MSRGSTFSVLLGVLCLQLMAAGRASAAGTLSPTSSADPPVGMVDDHVEVVIDNGFARVEVTQTFHNDGDHGVEAAYEFPLPHTASLAEMSIMTGEQSLRGEVVARDRAQDLYQTARDSGNQAGLATQESYQRFEFRIARVPEHGDVTVSFVYYQPLALDTGIGRLLYPLQEGGTDASAAAFWQLNDQVDKSFSAHVLIKSAYPIDSLRIPDFQGARTQQAKGVWEAWIDPAPTKLDHDLVLYYRLQGGLPGRVEVIPYRADAKHEGTVMLVLTPGIDLPALTHGGDYVLVLDVSGSMASKLPTLTDAVARFLDTLGEGDRFRIVKFSTVASEVTAGWQTVGDSTNARNALEALTVEGGTDVYSGLKLALSFPEEGRATNVVLVTDGVANTGIVDPKAFDALVRACDVRIFGLLLSNSANWPLMQLVADVSGGAYQQVSTADDVFGQVMQIKSKMTHEALHDVHVSVTGAGMSDLSDAPRKVFLGQQLVLFGHYSQAGDAKLTLKVSFTGKPQTYSTQLTLPEQAIDNPELERLWAINRVEQLEYQRDVGLLDPSEAAKSIEAIGVQYQIVTDETSLVVLSDAAFDKNGVARDNAVRSAREAGAQTVKMQAAPVNYTVQNPAPAPSSASASYGSGGGSGGSSFGGGAVDARDALWMLMLLLVCFALHLQARAARGARGRR